MEADGVGVTEEGVEVERGVEVEEGVEAEGGPRANIFCM